MRILHVIPTLGLGGAEKLLVDSLKYYKQNNIKCSVAVLSNYDNLLLHEIELLGVELFVSNVQNVYSLKNIGFLKKVITEHKFDLIHSHLFAAQFYIAVVSRLCFKNNIQLITTEHSTNNRRRGNILFKGIDNFIYKKYKKIICISSAVQKELIKYLPWIEDKSLVIHNGIEVQSFQAAYPIDWDKVIDNYNNEIIILMVASLRHQKDPYTLIDAAKILGTKYRVVFVGEGEISQSAKIYAQQQAVDNVTFLGKRMDVPNIMKASDIFVLSSQWEGFGLVVVEAAASGLPIIASDVPGLREVVININGQLFEPKNAKELVRKVNLVSSFPSKLNENYRIDKMVNLYINEYESCVNKE